MMIAYVFGLEPVRALGLVVVEGSLGDGKEVHLGVLEVGQELLLALGGSLRAENAVEERRNDLAGNLLGAEVLLKLV